MKPHLPIIISESAILHVTRHLAALSEEAKGKMLSFQEVLVTEERLLELMETLGSKFNTKIADPFRLLDFCSHIAEQHLSSEARMPWKQIGERNIGEFQVTISPDQKLELGLRVDDLLGTSSVIEITDKLEPMVKTEKRGHGEATDGVDVNVLSGVDPAWTDNLIITLADTGQSIEILTAYTGILAPVFPAKLTQTPEEFVESSAFWATHAFIK